MTSSSAYDAQGPARKTIVLQRDARSTEACAAAPVHFRNGYARLQSAHSLLAERAMRGYDLISEYERQEVVDWASLSKAQVYYALQKLERLGLIAAAPDTEPKHSLSALGDAGADG